MSDNPWLRERLKTHAWIRPGLAREIQQAYALTLREATQTGMPMVSEGEYVRAYRDETAIAWTEMDRAVLAEAKIAP